MATAAIRAGKVHIGEQAPKASHEIRAGELIIVEWGPMQRTFRVHGIPASRVGAKLVPQFAEELTPPSEREKLHQERGLRPLFPSLRGVFTPEPPRES